MSDKIVRGIALGGRVRFFVTKTTETVERARQIHDTYPAASAALGRVMSVAVIMGSTLKSDEEKLVIEIKSDGELNHILVNADNRGFIRGLVSNPHVHQVNEATGKLDVGGIVGSGFLRVTHKTGDTATFSSQTELQTGEIGDDFAYYYAQSEQVPSALSVGVLVNEDLTIKSAGAILVQVLPEATEEDIVTIEKVFAELPPVSELMVNQEAIEVAANLFDETVILQTGDVQYFCGCNKTQMRDVLRTLNTEDLQALIEEDHGATLKCHYCNTEYKFKEEELVELIDERKKN
ncbi:Hsp33 family molecular chaperone HslO [Erysipelothrix sp. HDW6C]|uniref:Hsp33 family molecular chaperone HslO n=1 Tax=Erysipelothrix sp. HDW6C TaxID=2714930 RepID=UPI00140E799B|nr:Hsp33 family molecular chaperone HslO [Erysipelothrix sp. HDW6C]QIK68933.1 Hsp33 family molecular chaperone HslO [Erysipelothrix sp. HDW6C]